MNFLQNLLFIILLFGFFACGTDSETITNNPPQNENQIENQIEDQIEIQVEDTVIVEHIPTTVISLNGIVYQFGPELDNNCQLFSEGSDCDGSKMLFLNDSEFLDIAYCGADKYASMGTYLIETNSVKITYSGIHVRQEYDFDHNEKITTEKNDPKTSTLFSYLCNGEIILELDSKEPYFGTVDYETWIDGEIETLKEEKIWEKLK